MKECVREAVCVGGKRESACGRECMLEEGAHSRRCVTGECVSARGEDSAGKVREVRENECMRATVHRADYRSAGTHGSRCSGWVLGGASRGGREPVGSGASERPVIGEDPKGFR